MNRVVPLSDRVRAWTHGIIAPWYLRPSQLDIYELLLLDKNPFIEAARRFGKTTSILCHVLEQLLANSGWICRWCEPWKNQATEIVIPVIDGIQRDIPHELRFQYQVTGSVFVAPNGSRLSLRGVNEDRGESARGPASNIIVGDELGSWRHTDYVMNEVLRPQLQTTDGQFIVASSPSADLQHPYYELRDRALAEKRFIQKLIYDNETMTPSKIEKIIEEVGGSHKAAWRREYLCEPVSDPDALVIPEYEEKIHDIPDETPYPECFDTYVGVDLGFNDSTALIFAYYDFQKATLVIDDEFVASGKNSREISAAARTIEELRWPKHAPPDRVGDNDPQQLYDMGTLCDYWIRATQKDDKIAAINELRLRFSRKRILIKKRCALLRYQLKTGLWNERRTDYVRGEKTGHLDAIDALVYLHRNVNWARNPYPAFAGASPYTHHIPEGSAGGHEEPGTGALKKIF